MIVPDTAVPSTSLIVMILQQSECGTDEWIAMIQDYSKLETLDRPTLLKLIQKIEVGERKVVDGQEEREIKIYYNFVGFVEV